MFVYRAIVGLLALALCVGCVSLPEPDIGPVRLTVGTNAIYPPLTFLRDGELAGVEIELADKLSRELGIGIDVVDMHWDELIPALQAGRIDVIMSGMSVTLARSRQVDFSVPYLRVGQMALVRREDQARLLDPAELNRPETRVGFEAGTTGELFATTHLTGSRRQAFPSPVEGIASLRVKQIDVFVHDAPTIWLTVGGLESGETELIGLYRPLTDERLAWAVRKGDEATLDLLNSALSHWRDRGELEQVLDRWIPVRKYAIEEPGSVLP